MNDLILTEVFCWVTNRGTTQVVERIV